MLILASKSPQRRAILTAIGLEFRVLVSGFVETERGADPVALAKANAAGKARDVVTSPEVASGDVVLGVDTVVIIDGHSLGTPDSEEEAQAMLTSLSGREHAVVSALCLLSENGEFAQKAQTLVCFRDLSSREVSANVKTGEWRGRAGGYAIQGAGMALVSEIHGEYSNVVGLPVSALLQGLATLGAHVSGVGSG